MKVVSFLPAATQMLYDMGLQHLLAGVTFECPAIARQEKPILVHCVLEGKDLTSEEIDRIFSASKAQGKSLYYVNDALLQQIGPDVVLTQDVCEVCQIDTRCTLASLQQLERWPQVITLTPMRLADVMQDAVRIATAVGHEEAAYHYLAGLQQRLQHLVTVQQSQRLMPRRVLLLEWMQPLYNCGHWIPDQLAWAGGIDMCSNPGGDSVPMLWDKLLKYDPEVLIIAPCGFDINRSLQELHLLTTQPGWHDLTAVKNKEVYLLDFDLFTQPSASTLVEGCEVLAALFHPAHFKVPAQSAHRFVSLAKQLPVA